VRNRFLKPLLFQILNLYRYTVAYFGEGCILVGRCTLTPPDPYLKGAWYTGGFNPWTYQVKKRFQILPFKFNSHRYVLGDVRRRENLRAQGTVGRCTLNYTDPPPPRLIGWNMCRPMRRLNGTCADQ
jgi:hypothetical protein